MTNKEHLQKLFNIKIKDVENMAEFLYDISSDCDKCRIKDFCDRSVVYRCKDVWQDWLTSEYGE